MVTIKARIRVNLAGKSGGNRERVQGRKVQGGFWDAGLVLFLVLSSDYMSIYFC